MITVKLTKDMGRGVFTTNTIKKGDIVATCEILELSEKDTAIVNSTDLQYYTFKLDMKRDCLVMGLGEIFNHSDNANVSYKLVQIHEEHGSRLVMQYRATMDINANAQLFIDYTADENVDTNKYTVNLTQTA